MEEEEESDVPSSDEEAGPVRKKVRGSKPLTLAEKFAAAPDLVQRGKDKIFRPQPEELGEEIFDSEREEKNLDVAMKYGLRVSCLFLFYI